MGYTMVEIAADLAFDRRVDDDQIEINMTQKCDFLRKTSSKNVAKFPKALPGRSCKKTEKPAVRIRAASSCANYLPLKSLPQTLRTVV
jgi:hypothetical protein